MKKATVMRRTLPQGRRVIAVSDIHGNLDFLQKLLEQVSFSKEDILIIIGDALEKGPRSLDTLRYLMALSQTHTVWPICGNCDDLVLNFIDQVDWVPDEVFAQFLSIWGEHSTITQMGREAGLTGGELGDFALLRGAMRTQFGPELAYLRSWPTILETQKYLFVHGGVNSRAHMEELESWQCMKHDDFLHQETHLDKWCVVGHWPVTLYHDHIPCAAPIVTPEKKIISIDGGCVLKVDGQLNAMILPDGNSDDFTFTWYDGLSVVTALDAQEASTDSVNIRWGRNVLEVLERGDEFCRCRHLESGRELDILTEYLWERKGLIRCEDSTDFRLGVEPGDALAVVRRTSRGILAKKDGATGWYSGRTK